MEGVSRCVGEAVRDLGAISQALSQKKVIAVGVMPWGMVHNRSQLVNAQVLIIQYAFQELVLRWDTLQLASFSCHELLLHLN